MTSDQKGIVLVVIGMVLFSVQDALIKNLSTHASLIQIFVCRGVIGMVILSIFLRLTNRKLSIKSNNPKIAITRGLLFPFAFLCFYLAIAAMPIAEASALFFVSPFFMTILSKIILKNKVGIHRLVAIMVGFVGIIFIIKPEFANFNWVMILPIVCAFAYSLSMILTIYTKDSDTTYQQTSHVYLGSIAVGTIVYLVFGNFNEHYSDNPSLSYLLRAWDFTDFTILFKILVISFIGTIGILCLINAYRIGLPSVVSPFEYTMIINALIIGYFIFDEQPDYYSIIGMTLIILSGIYIFFRERPRKTKIVTENSLRK